MPLPDNNDFPLQLFCNWANTRLVGNQRPILLGSSRNIGRALRRVVRNVDPDGSAFTKATARYRNHFHLIFVSQASFSFFFCVVSSSFSCSRAVAFSLLQCRSCVQFIKSNCGLLCSTPGRRLCVRIRTLSSPSRSGLRLHFVRSGLARCLFFVFDGGWVLRPVCFRLLPPAR